MAFLHSLKTASKEFLRNFKTNKDQVQPPYGCQYNSRASQKTSNNIAKLILPEFTKYLLFNLWKPN